MVDGVDGVNGVDGVSQLEPTYYVRKRKELGLDRKSRKNKTKTKRSVLKLTPALSKLLNESRSSRKINGNNTFINKGGSSDDNAQGGTIESETKRIK